MLPSILVVDDEHHFLTLMDFAFSKRGYHVTTARDGVEALQHVDSKTFAAAVLDIKMHPVGGIEVLAEIKKRHPATPVIMITGYPTDETRNECIKLGAGAYMTKPVDLTELDAVLNHLVSAPRIAE